MRRGFCWSGRACSACDVAPELAALLSRFADQTGDSGTRHVLDLDVPLITLPVMPGRNLAVLTEAATRLHILRTKGIDPAAMFIARHSNLLERSNP